MNSLEIEETISDLEEVELYLARNYMLDFTETTKPDYDTQWFHRLLCEKLDDLANFRIKKLMVFMPPQHGKSELVSRRFPAFLLGKNPKMKIAACSYAADLAAKFNREVQRIIDDPVYASIFPETKLNDKNIVSDSRGSWLRNSEEFEVVNYGGSYKGVGVMGPLTGNPVDFGGIDDPIKDRMEAQSPTYRDRLWDWYNDVFCYRLHNNSRVLLTMTPWHEDDLAGRIIKNEKGWVILSTPGIKEIIDPKKLNQNHFYCDVSCDPRQVGEALWEEKHSKKKFLEQRAKSERSFIAMVQLRPAAQEGNIFKEKWFKYYSPEQLPPTCDEIIISFDCAFKDQSHNDFVAATAWCKVGPNAFLLDVIRGHWGFVDTLKKFDIFYKKWSPQSSLIEDKANGTAIIEVLKQNIPGIVPISPRESKVARAEAVSFLFEAGNVFFPVESDWIEEYEDELKSFPNATHDDQVDSTTQALNKMFNVSKTTMGKMAW